MRTQTGFLSTGNFKKEEFMKAYTLGMYEKAVPNELSWKEKLEAARTAGYDFFEISIDETEEKLNRLKMSGEERQKLCQLMHEIGMPIRSMCLSGHRKYPMGSSSPQTEQRSMEIMEDAIQFADDLGIRMIMLAGYDVYYEEGSEETAARFLKNLEKAVKLAARHGMILAFETMETDFMNTTGKAMEYVRKIASPYLQVYPDIGNITNAAVAAGTDVLEDLRSGSGNLAALHLKETMPGKFRDMMYGDGHVDFESAIKTAWELGIRRYVTEFWYLGSETWREDLKKAHDAMSSLLDKQ